MLPSSTVENYLKAIYRHEIALPVDQLVPMGQIAATLGVAPGTATTMVKTLADSGLVRYEPYSGVRLTRAGEKLAALVLRRHRLVELFLVEVMGMSWAEVHDEAEKLEHVVSDRLIERMDQMLGHPATDPHGDPIPDPEGTLRAGVLRPHELQTLLTCPLNTRVTVTRISDQDAAFLRFIETYNLKPGQAIEVEARDPAADSVRIRSKDDRQFTIGARAASKLLDQLIGALLIVIGWSRSASAQATRQFEIIDNSFLVEEAFNQEPGIFQNILTFERGRHGEWEAVFTQEWPLAAMAHQFSYTVPFSGGGGRGIGDVSLNYRFQAMTETGARPAFAPRFTLILPSGDEQQGFGHGVAGWQVNLAFSKQIADTYLHWNAGVTQFSGVATPGRLDREETTANLLNWKLGGSAIWRARPMFHLMLEGLAAFDALPAPFGSSTRSQVITIAPGVRSGWNIGDAQLIVGLAVPLSFAHNEPLSARRLDAFRALGAEPPRLDDDRAALAYVSYELPFKKP